MAVGDVTLIAKESSVQTVITNQTTLLSDTDTLKTDTTTIKNLLANGSTFGDNLVTQTTDLPNLVVNLTGKYELIGLSIQTTGYFSIQIDGATNRKLFPIVGNAPISFINALGLGIKCNTSMNIYSSALNNKAMYRLLP